MKSQQPIDIPAVLSIFGARWSEKEDTMYRGFDSPELIPEALHVLERLVELLIRYPRTDASQYFVNAAPDFSERHRLWNVAMKAVEERAPQPRDRTPDVLRETLQALQAEDPAFRKTDEQTFARMMLRATLLGMTSAIANSLDDIFWRNGIPEPSDDPAIVEPLARLLPRCSALREGDNSPIDWIPTLSADALAPDVVVPIMHDLLRDERSTERLRKRVLENLDRHELPRPPPE